jgi:hypothetical protein
MRESMMTTLQAWDVAILVVAAYLSVVTLVRLMRARRDELIAQFQSQVGSEQRRKRSQGRGAPQVAGREKPKG